MDPVTIDDIRKAGHCVRGARRWFESHGLDFGTFLERGIAAEALLATGDALADQVIQRKMEREARG